MQHILIDPYKVDDEDKDEVSLSTVENLDIVKSCFPSQVEVFLDSKSLSKSPKLFYLGF